MKSFLKKVAKNLVVSKIILIFASAKPIKGKDYEKVFDFK